MPSLAPHCLSASAREATTLVSTGFSHRRVRGDAFWMYLPSM